jgi:hypothetical protein
MKNLLSIKILITLAFSLNIFCMQQENSKTLTPYHTFQKTSLDGIPVEMQKEIMKRIADHHDIFEAGITLGNLRATNQKFRKLVSDFLKLHPKLSFINNNIMLHEFHQGNVQMFVDLPTTDAKELFVKWYLYTANYKSIKNSDLSYEYICKSASLMTLLHRVHLSHIGFSKDERKKGIYEMLVKLNGHIHFNTNIDLG